MVRPTKSLRDSGTDIELEFEVSPEDESGNLREDLKSDNEIAIFPDAVENFKGLIISGDSSELDFYISIGRGELSGGTIGRETIVSVIPDPTTLDLVARKGEVDLFGTVYPSIKYSFVGGELTGSGIDELSIILLDADADDDNEFQVVLDSSGNSIRDLDPDESGFQFSGADDTTKTIRLLGDLIPDNHPDTISDDEQIVADEGLTIFEIDTQAAINDIRYITGEDESSSVSPLVLADTYSLSVSTPSASDSEINSFSEINRFDSIGETVVGETVVIEAEDLNDFNLIGNVYREETIGSGEDSFEVISLRDSSNFGARDVSGEVRLIVGSDQVDISGDYDLTISTFDENDGKGTIEVLVNGERRGEIITLSDINENPTAPNNYPNEDIRQEFTFGLGELEEGEEIIIRGTSNGEEFVRLDFITFTEVI